MDSIEKRPFTQYRKALARLAGLPLEPDGQIVAEALDELEALRGQQERVRLPSELRGDGRGKAVRPKR